MHAPKDKSPSQFLTRVPALFLPGPEPDYAAKIGRRQTDPMGTHFGPTVQL